MTSSPEYQKLWWEKNKEKYRERRREYEENYRHKSPEARLLVYTKSRAKKLGIPFNLELEDISIPDLCPILGVKMERKTRYAPSIDKFIPALGYIKGNVWVVSMLANSMKSDATPEQLERFAHWVLNQ